MLFQCCQIRRQANSPLVICKEMKELANLTALKVGVIIFNIFTERLVGISIGSTRQKDFKYTRKYNFKFVKIEILLPFGCPTQPSFTPFWYPQTTKFHSISRSPTTKFNFIWESLTTALMAQARLEGYV